ncbi:hypothetical protein SprV_0702392700 [Sparganum proliferum]
MLIHYNLPQPFGILSGVLKGCIPPPMLFNYAVDWILGRSLHGLDGIYFELERWLTDLDYATDTASLSSRFGDLQTVTGKRSRKIGRSVCKRREDQRVFGLDP